MRSALATRAIPNTQVTTSTQFAPGEVRLKLLVTMAEFFKTLGYTDIKARFAGYTPPGELKGVISDHRPDLTCIQNDRRNVPIILDVVTPAEYRNQINLRSRCQLFASVRGVYNSEFHLAVPNMKLDGEWLDERMKLMLQKDGITANRIWVL